MKMTLLTFIFIISGLWGISQTTYTWDGSTNTSWTVADNWTPIRTTPAVTDILQFNSGGNIAVSFNYAATANQSIGSLLITGNTNVTISKANNAFATQTLTIGGAPNNGTLNIASGSTLNLEGVSNGGAKSLTLAFGAGSVNTGTIAGTFNLRSNGQGVGAFNTANSATVVTGTLSRNSDNGLVTSTALTLSFSGGTYIHNVNGLAVPTATWSASSLLNVTGLTTTYPTGMSQSFGNVLFNSALTGNPTMAQNLTTAGNLTISNTGVGILTLSGTAFNGAINVGGAFSMTSGNFTLVGGAGTGTMNVTGNFSKSGASVFNMKTGAGAAALNVAGNFSQSGTGTLNVTNNATATSKIDLNGNFSLSGGIIDMSSAAGGIGELNIAGDFQASAGNLTELGSNSGSIIFDGAGTQIYSSGTTISNQVNFTLKTGSTLQFSLPTTTVTGDGTFTVQAGSFLGIRHADGISTTNGVGQVQVTGVKSYSTAADYEYNGSVAQSTGNGLTGASSLTIDNNSVGGVTLTNNNIAVTGNLLIRAGSLSAGAQTLLVGGNWTNNGASFNAGTGNVVLDGTGNQLIGGIAVTSFNNLNLNKTTGTVALAQSQNVNGNLNIGVNLDLGSFNLTMGAASANIGTLGAAPFSATKMIVASGSGELRKIFGPATAATYAFPIGDNTAGADYSPAGITFTTPSTSNGYVALKVVDDKHPNNGHVNSFLSRYWTVTQSGLTTFTALVGFTYVDADINGPEANIRLGKWDAVGPWTRYGAGSMNNALNSMVSDPVGSFSDFSGLDFLEILPVNFGKFRGWAPNTSINTIEWEVFAETGVDKYEIEKLSSGDVFRTIGVQAPSNNGLDLTYTFNDNAPNGGDNFYRIKATEFTGEVTYSPVVRVRNGGVTATAMKVYPNPVTGSTVNVSLQGIKAGKYEMVVSNNAGQVIYRSTTEQRAGNVMVQIPVSNTLPKGIYRVKVSNGENVMLSSFIKE